MRSSPLLHVTMELDYALRALVELAEAGAPLTCDQLAAASGVPARYLSNGLQKLRRAGLIRRRSTATAGGGGFELAAASPAAVPLAAVVAAIQGVWAGAPDGSGGAGGDPLGPLWARIEGDLEAQLSALTVADLCAARSEAQAAASA